MDTLSKSLPWFALILSVVFLPGLISPMWIPKMAYLSVFLPLLLLFTQPPSRSTYTWLILATFIWSAATVFWSFSKIEAVNGLWYLTTFLGCILLGLGITGDIYSRTIKWAAYGLIASVIVGFAQYNGYWIATFPETETTPTGLFVNSRIFGEVLALGGCALLIDNWVIAAVFIVGCYFTESRNGACAAGIALVIYLIKTRQVTLAWLISGVGAFGITVATLVRGCPQWRCTVDALGSGRVSLWLDTVRGLTLLGRGIGNYYVAFPDKAHDWTPLVHGRPEQAHNDFLQMFFEAGVPGGLLLVALFVYALTTNRSYLSTVSYNEYHARDRALLVAAAGCSEALFGFPLHLPVSLFMVGLSLGYLVRSGRPIRLHLRHLYPRRPSVAPDCIHVHASGLSMAVRPDGER